MKSDLDAILLLFHRPPRSDADTVWENIDAFSQYSRHPVVAVNTDESFPRGLADVRFRAIVLHYSLFSPIGYHLERGFAEWLASQTDSYKIAIFQDEHHYNRMRFAFLREHAIDCVYTQLEPEHVPKVYGVHTDVPHVISHIPGYVSERLLAAAERWALPEEERTVDIGYRGRSLLYYMGRGAREKYDIGIAFKERANALGLTLDISCEESARIYGEDWDRFVGRCRAMLGTESGVSVYDLDDRLRLEFEQLLAERPGMTFDEYAAVARLDPHEERIPYRTISPRHFEAAAFGTPQILYEGRYSGLMRPWEHFIPLRKDMSNFDEVIEAFRDDDQRREIAARARTDLIESGAHTYERFMERFDEHLRAVGVTPQATPAEVGPVRQRIEKGRPLRLAARRARYASYRQFPGRPLAVAVARPFVRTVRRARAAR